METGTLRKLNVQPGDVVECVATVHPKWWSVGGHYTANQSGNLADDQDDTVSLSDADRECNWRIISRAAPTGPVRTVTRKEIVTGKFGIVDLAGVDKDCVQIRLQGPGVLKTWFTAPELRAAIATLTEIADALEDTQ